ncbi:MAG: hypothetical protein ACXWNI_07885 [Candidatus Limnocylindrales bacterium]
MTIGKSEIDRPERDGQFKPDEDLARKMAELATTLVAGARRDSIELDFSTESLDAAFEWAIGDLRPSLGHVPGREADGLVDYLAVRLGAYVGESTRRSRGGEWGWIVADSRERRETVRDGSGAVSHPVELARDRVYADRGRLEALARVDRMFGRH